MARVKRHREGYYKMSQEQTGQAPNLADGLEDRESRKSPRGVDTKLRLHRLAGLSPAERTQSIPCTCWLRKLGTFVDSNLGWDCRVPPHTVCDPEQVILLPRASSFLMCKVGIIPFTSERCPKMLKLTK